MKNLPGKAPAFVRLASSLWAGLAQALCPDACMACGRLLPPKEEQDLAAPVPGSLCPACASDIAYLTGPLCISCGAAFPSASGPDHLCGACMERKNHFSRARAAASYEGSLAEAVKHYKYGRKLWMAEPLSQLLETACNRHFTGEAFDMVAPVPLYSARLRWRGFNQVQAMLLAWRKRNTLPGALAPALRRVRATRPQAGLGGEERARNVKDAFRALERISVSGRTVLLVDDVYTTGATVREASRALLAAGAARVDVLTVARVAE
ncbi:MAG: ComF family protein [Thermodesulfobacteriota bacterium]